MKLDQRTQSQHMGTRNSQCNVLPHTPKPRGQGYIVLESRAGRKSAEMGGVNKMNRSKKVQKPLLICHLHLSYLMNGLSHGGVNLISL